MDIVAAALAVGFFISMLLFIEGLGKV